MAKHDNDPVLARLVHSVNESGQAAVPVTVSAHGVVLTGELVAEDRYFADLVRRNPLMSALQPSSGLLGKEYAKDVEAESGHHLHLRTDGIPGGYGGSGDTDAEEHLWRISLEAVDGWTLRSAPDADNKDASDRGPFAKLLGTS